MKAGWMRWGCAALAAGLASMHLANAADAAHAAGVARAMGLDAQPWGALDAVVAWLFAWLPVGTLAARAAMGSVVTLAAAGAVLFDLARGLLGRCAETRRIGVLVSLVAAGCAVLGPAWQLEGAAPAGSVLGALLALVPLAVLIGAEETAPRASTGPKPRCSPWALSILALTLAFGQDPRAALVGLVGCTVLVATAPASRQRFRAAWRKEWPALVAWGAGGLLPVALSIARTRGAGPLFDALLEVSAAERGTSAMGAPWGFVRTEVGVVMVALAVTGVVLSQFAARARSLGAALASVAVSGLSCGCLGSALGPSRYGAPVLAAAAAIYLLAGVAMQALVRAIAEARIPMARASAAMILVLECVAPVDAADEAWRRGAARGEGHGRSPASPVIAWDEAAWGALPSQSVVLVTDPRIWRRAAAARATGSLRDDVTVVPTYARGTLAAPFLSHDPAFVPLWRDLALTGAPTEASLSTLASARPVFASFDPAWGKPLGKHLVPEGLFDRLEPEPRGASDRRRGLESFASERLRLHDTVRDDPELADATAFLLRQRVLGMIASGDREELAAAAADVEAFAPHDPVLANMTTARSR